MQRILTILLVVTFYAGSGLSFAESSEAGAKRAKAIEDTFQLASAVVDREPSVITSQAELSPRAQNENNYWPGKIRLSALGSTERRGIFYIDYLTPLYYSRDQSMLVFFNPKQNVFSPNGLETNLGTGIRKIFDDKFILGFHVFFDKKYSSHQKWYSQVGYGLEFLSEPFDFRFNYYNPLTKPKELGGTEIYKLGSSSLLSSSNLEEPLPGYDFEFGIPLGPKAIKSRIYFGGFFYNSRYSRDVNGWKIRTETDINKWFALDLAFNSRNAQETEFIGGIRVTLPFEWGRIKNKKTPFKSSLPDDFYIKNRLFERVVRDIDVQTTDKGMTPLAPETDESVIYVDNSNSGSKDGTLEHPWNTLAESVADSRYIGNSGPAKYIYVFRGTGDSYAGGLQLADTAVLWGSAATGGFNGLAVTDYPIVDGGVAMLDRNTVQGLKLQNGEYGVYGENITSGTIHNNYITDCEIGIGIYNSATTLTNLTISDNTIVGNPGDGIHMENHDSSTMSGVTISGNRIGGSQDGEGNGGDGIYLDNDSGNVSDFIFTGNTITGNTWNGISVNNLSDSPAGTASGFTFTDNTITGNGGDGIDVYNWCDTISDFTFDHNTITENYWVGIDVYNSNSSPMGTVSGFTFANNTISGSPDGIYVYNSSNAISDFTFNNNTITGNDWGWNGIGVYNYSSSSAGGTVSGFTFNRNAITGNPCNGIDVYNAVDTISDFTFDHNTLTGNGWNGIAVLNTSSSPDPDAPGDTVSEFTFSGNTITGNARDGIYMENHLFSTALRFDIKDNAIYGNAGFDLNNNSGIDDLLAENNWWGSNVDPGLNGQIGGANSVDYDPWLSSAPN